MKIFLVGLMTWLSLPTLSGTVAVESEIIGHARFHRNIKAVSVLQKDLQKLLSDSAILAKTPGDWKVSLEITGFSQDEKFYSFLTAFVIDQTGKKILVKSCSFVGTTDELTRMIAIAAAKKIQELAKNTSLQKK